MAPIFGTATIMLLMVVPLLSMRLIAEERRNQTLPFLLSAPVSIAQIVLGKFLGAAGVPAAGGGAARVDGACRCTAAASSTWGCWRAIVLGPAAAV